MSWTLGEALLTLGEFEKSAAYCEESITLLRDMSDYWVIGGPMSCLGLIAYYAGDLQRASALSQEALLYFRQYGEKRGMAFTLTTLGLIANSQHQYERATAFFRESLSLRQSLVFQRGTDICFEELAKNAIRQGNGRQAAFLFSATNRLRQGFGNTEADTKQHYFEQVNADECQLDYAEFISTWNEAQTLTINDAIARVLEAIPSSSNG